MMVPDKHREELVLLVLSRVEMPLDATSIAATYDTPVAGWTDALEALEAEGYVAEIDDGLYQLTTEGETATLSRGSKRHTLAH